MSTTVTVVSGVSGRYDDDAAEPLSQPLWEARASEHFTAEYGQRDSSHGSIPGCKAESHTRNTEYHTWSNTITSLFVVELLSFFVYVGILC